MKVLIHGINYSPELTGIGKYSAEMAEWLAARGHEVRVVTTPPYYPEWRVGKGFKGTRYKIQGAGGKGQGKSNGEVGIDPCALNPVPVVVYRCPLWVPANPSGVKRLIHLASFALSSFPVMLRQVFWNPDVVWVVEPALFCAPQAYLVARLSRARCWLHIQDFEVDAAFDMGILPPGKLRNLVLWFERVLMRRFDCVSTISTNMLLGMVAKGVEPSRAVLFPNWVDTDVIHPLEGMNGLRAELGIASDRIVALYSGNMGEKQGLEVVLEAACKLADQPHIQFVLCGDGAARRRLMESHPDLPNVMWIPLQPMERLNDLLNMADIHLLPQRADAADLVMPSKLTGMLASGRPIITTAQAGTQVAKVVTGCGLVTQPGDGNEFLQAVLSLSQDASLRAEYGEKARIFAVEYLDKQAIIQRFEKDLLILASA